MMNLDSFLHNLQCNTNKVRLADWQVDWEDAPLPYKLYHNLSVFPLITEVPLKLERYKESVKSDLRTIGDFLWYVFGLSQVSQYFNEVENVVEYSYRRFVPSGGALYPNELYVYLKAEGLPFGVYHYDAAHHCLVLLREGNFDSYISRSLGDRCDLSACFGTVFVSTMFWKNFFKYNNFSYRLQGLDAGVLIGQLLEVAKRFGFETGVYFQFLDRAINHLLGLSEHEESVYAVIPLSLDSEVTWFVDRTDAEEGVSAAELCQEVKKIQHNHYIRSKKIIEYPMLIKMNEASLIENTRLFQQIKRKKNGDHEGEPVTLPHTNRLTYDMALACKKRYSPNMDFVLGKVSQSHLAALLQEATSSFLYRNDLDGGNEKAEPRVSLYGCLYNIEDVPNGVYKYDSTAHTLQRIRLGDHRLWFQHGMPGDNINLLQVPLCLHVVGEKEHLKTELGYRGYRIQQMEAGMLVQRLLLAASCIEMGGHPLLGFDVNLCDMIYKINFQGETSLIQIPIGSYRHRPWLKGSLHG